MTLSRTFHSLLVGVLLFCAVSTALAGVQDEANSGKAGSGTEKEKTTLIELYSWANILPRELLALQGRLAEDRTATIIKEELPKVADELRQLAEKLKAVNEPGARLTLLDLSNLQAQAARLAQRLKRHGAPVDQVVTRLSEERKVWTEKKEAIRNYEKSDKLTLALAKEQQQEMTRIIDTALGLLDRQLRDALQAGKAVGNLQIDLYSVETELKGLQDRLEATSIEKTSPSVLSREFYTNISLTLITESLTKSWRFLVNQVQGLKYRWHLVVYFMLGVGLCCFLVRQTRKLAPPTSRWQIFAAKPLSTTIFLLASIDQAAGIMGVELGLPSQWQSLQSFFMLLALMVLTRLLIASEWWRTVLVRLTAYLVVVLLLIIADLPPLVILLYVVSTAFAILLWYLYQLPKIAKKGGAQVWLRAGVGLIPALIVLSGLAGFDQLAVMAFSTLLGAVISCLVIWMLYQLNMGLAEMVIFAIPIDLVRANWQRIIDSLRPIMVLGHIVLLLSVQGVVLKIFPSVDESFQTIFDIGFTLGGIHISPGFFLSIALVVYGALLFSRAIQTVLLEKVLPRYGAGKGVQLSIARLTHYAILIIGFIVMLRILGVNPNQITLLGGALGVGIGFGLQAIVNNFASGLILLFERPIKVGDTIQVGTDLGEVKKMGLRATIIQTFDNAEIVVPNSDLVTGQVINWTLAERKVRVRIPVGVAYGSDVGKVLKILKECAVNNPMVLSTPQPTAFFLAFGNSSLDCELRVWIPEFLDKTQVLSDLNLDIESEFALNDIEIPFPQTDLHLRSVDEQAAGRLGGGGFVSRSASSLQSGQEDAGKDHGNGEQVVGGKGLAQKNNSQA